MHMISRRGAMKWSAGVAASAAAFNCNGAFADSAPQDALAVMSADPRFSIWVEVLRFAGLQDYAAGSGNFTAFIPTDTAFQKYPWVVTDVLRSRSRAFPETTTQVEFIRSHVILDLHPLSEFSGRTATVTSVAGYPIMINGLKSGSYTVTWQSLHDRLATAEFTNSPIITSNALLYPFDDVSFGSS